ncbi:SDR family NAD(P)-dependent oxidoreductase [Kribbella sp. NBC_00889]|uniref:SDR family NAD(P)-dependent oxidoreductase n=1 Tax=Kribbella sp. NBC_00889 TaxID=2975974 RepID=UPI0038699731|nr:SDR family oxidoreductase [Kribbella sp. NBC_00889]
MVTGGGSAIGRAIAGQLGAAGVAVAVVAMSRARADATVEAVRAAGGEAEGFTADLYDPGSIPGLVHAVEQVLGEVDILVNNAATVTPLGPVADLDSAAVLRALTINVASVVTLAGVVIPAMSRRGWGRIANVCGVIGNLASWAGGNIYAACAAALEAHTVNLAAELTGTGITVNALRVQRMGTSVRTWLAAVDPAAIDDPLIRRFIFSQTDIGTVDFDRSAAILLGHLATTETGHVWSAVHSGPVA